MAFWLARAPQAQDSSFIQRFDPRFWTVNFPRPAMASVVTTGPAALRVDLELHHAGELVGLIWDSLDSLDHPLLAYATDRDYAHTVLSFRWQSDGVIALDQPNGPTLTIEGRDAAGQPQVWYVRLWNYATGTPTDARITLPFSALESGYGLPGEPIFAGDIDRMFISLVAPGFVAGSTAPLPAPVLASVTLSDIVADGARAMIALGDVLVPPHGERMATAYDDAYNQTPARLLRAVTGLGYREDIVHYVGMSHFMRLTRQPDGSLLAASDGALCTPAAAWHRSFFALAQEAGFAVIASLSYELFDAYCPPAWKQRTASGAPALTGWVPPSTLLSPANPQAMAWLADVAQRFVALLQEAGQPVRFQIGEPWWWVTPAREICLYDDAASAAFGGDPPVIADIAAPLDAGATALLDAAGVLLAQSTAALTAAVRAAAAPGEAEVLLLAFTPTILAAATPELCRANLPAGWAAPAFDRLQLEDYDWLTAGADAERRAAYEFVQARLGYALADQDYLAGFVLDPADAEAFWARIDAGIDEAAARGIPRRYVWALPQVSRDGYTRLAPPPEHTMDPFDDVPYPFALGRSASVAPEFSTSIAVTASGHERRNALWSDARLHFDVGPGIRSETELSQLIAFFRARRGPARGFRITDPFDNSSNGMTGTPTMLDQLIGVGDGLRADFPLVKSYGGAEPQVRPITRPQPATLVVSVGGAASTAWTLGEKGVLRFLAAPPAGAEVRAGFRFDVPVRFAEDRLDVSAVSFAAGEAPSVPLIEIRESA
jgi:uncharacterized protein (TIGR02217 family)